MIIINYFKCLFYRINSISLSSLIQPFFVSRQLNNILRQNNKNVTLIVFTFMQAVWRFFKYVVAPLCVAAPRLRITELEVSVVIAIT